MRNVMYLGLCWATTFGLVAVAVGQQAPAAPGADTWGPAHQPAAVQPITQPTAYGPDGREAFVNPPANSDLQRGVPAPRDPQNQPLITGTFQAIQPALSGQRRGELGVWMSESGGPGVQIQRITRGSAAAQAGLREGDVILQVNGRGAVSPQGTAQLIRQIAIGQTGMLTVWRDGNQQQVQVTMQPVREIARDLADEAPHQVGFEPADASSHSDLASRTMKLEQQIASLTQELASLRQELTQIRTAGPVQTGFNAEVNQGSTPQRFDNAQPSASAPAPKDAVAPPPGFGQPEEKPAKAIEQAKSATPTATVTEPAKPVPPAPAAEKSDDLFDSSQPKTEEKPKTGDQSKTDTKPKADESKDKKSNTDDLFK